MGYGAYFNDHEDQNEFMYSDVMWGQPYVNFQQAVPSTPQMFTQPVPQKQDYGYYTFPIIQASNDSCGDLSLKLYDDTAKTVDEKVSIEEDQVDVKPCVDNILQAPAIESVPEVSHNSTGKPVHIISNEPRVLFAKARKIAKLTKKKKNLSVRQTHKTDDKVSQMTLPSTVNTKKLRHREVEKNRHRNLQAMVRTLSEQTPGKCDKETQVQIMKRAARYIVYLREAYELLSVPALGADGNLKRDLSKVYLKSCEYINSLDKAKWHRQQQLQM